MLRIAEEALTFDDVLLVPGFSEVLPHQVELKTQLTKGITLNIPLVSAAMDTVTEAELAIAMAQEGGIGIMHKNMTVEQQAAAVRKVKKYESGVVKDPITVNPDTTVRELVDITMANSISGLPVVDGNDLVGIVTGRDIRFESRMDTPVRDIMTPKDKLVTVKEGASLEDVKELLHRHRIEKVLVVNDDFQLRGLITVKDIQKAKDYPLACKDEQGRLRVGAAVGTGGDTEARIAALAEAGVDVIVVDTPPPPPCPRPLKGVLLGVVGGKRKTRVCWWLLGKYCFFWWRFLFGGGGGGGGGGGWFWFFFFLSVFFFVFFFLFFLLFFFFFFFCRGVFCCFLFCFGCFSSVFVGRALAVAARGVGGAGRYRRSAGRS